MSRFKVGDRITVDGVSSARDVCGAGSMNYLLTGPHGDMCWPIEWVDSHCTLVEPDPQPVHRGSFVFSDNDFTGNCSHVWLCCWPDGSVTWGAGAMSCPPDHWIANVVAHAATETEQILAAEVQESRTARLRCPTCKGSGEEVVTQDGMGETIHAHITCSDCIDGYLSYVDSMKHVKTILTEARIAIVAATTIGERHRTPMNYGNHDRLVANIDAVLALTEEPT